LPALARHPSRATCECEQGQGKSMRIADAVTRD
jgi:hypothetical protein